MALELWNQRSHPQEFHALTDLEFPVEPIPLSLIFEDLNTDCISGTDSHEFPDRFSDIGGF
jgi:hypothetical protein